MAPELWSENMGQTHIASMLGVSNLDNNPLNMSVIAPTDLLLRAFYVNRTLNSAGRNGLQSFLDVSLMWDLQNLSQSLAAGQVAGIVVAIVAVAIGAVAAVLYMNRRWLLSSCCTIKPDKDPKGGSLLPRVLADTVAHFSGDKDIQGAASAPGELAANSAISSSRQKSGPSQDIVQACRNLFMRKSANEAGELVLQSVLGEGSYGKVRLSCDVSYQGLCSTG